MPRGCIVTALIAFVLYVAIATGLSQYDAATRKSVLQMAADELPSHASFAQVDGFMRRHTDSYDFDPDSDELAGFLPQSKADAFLMHRHVQVVLKVNRGSKTFKSAEVQTFYTLP